MTLAFLDIETSWDKSITVIGIHKAGEGIFQLVAPRLDGALLLEVMDDVDMLFTYNGARFDLPVITAHLGVILEERWPHRDLMHDCWRNQLKGGLKAIEQRLGIHRDSEGLSGFDALRLWKAHQNGHPEALEMLLRYNKEDCENLEILARKLNVL